MVGTHERVAPRARCTVTRFAVRSRGVLQNHDFIRAIAALVGEVDWIGCIARNTSVPGPKHHLGAGPLGRQESFENNAKRRSRRPARERAGGTPG